MKTSVSIPDDLWDCVKSQDEGASAVIQRALMLLCRSKQDPMGNAPSVEVKDRFRESMGAQAQRITEQIVSTAELGYELGVELSTTLGYVQVLSLPKDVSTFTQVLARVWNDDTDANDHIRSVSGFANFEKWRDDLLCEDEWNGGYFRLSDFSAVMQNSEEFWRFFGLAIERQIEAVGGDIIQVMALGTGPAILALQLESEHFFRSLHSGELDECFAEDGKTLLTQCMVENAAHIATEDIDYLKEFPDTIVIKVSVDFGTRFDTRNSVDWEFHRTPDGWKVPAGTPEIGRFFIDTGRLPQPFLQGVAAALIDLRTAVEASVQTPTSALSVAHQEPGTGVSL